MYYEEREFDGVLCWRDDPHGPWKEYSKKELSFKVKNSQKENRKLEMIIKEGLGPEDLKRDF